MADTATRVIPTTSGPVRGSSDGIVNKFQGIRYANSPAGANRWTPPVAPARSTTVFDATTPGSPCPQLVNQFSAPPPFSEDCLFLNVWTPANVTGAVRPAAPLPVFVYIYGGGFNEGSGAVAVYNGANLAKKGLVVVTVNYRGPFIRGRVLDLSTGAARAVGLTSAGVGRVTAEVI